MSVEDQGTEVEAEGLYPEVYQGIPGCTDMQTDITTIKLHKDTKEELDAFREHRNESYDEIVRKIVLIARQHEEVWRHYQPFLKQMQKELGLDDEGLRRVWIALVTQSSLAKDWLRPEEDEAWKDL